MQLREFKNYSVYYRFGRIIIVFALASYFVNLFYRDLFVISEHNKLLFLIGSLPCLHLLVTSMRLAAMLTGRQYRRYDKFTVVNTYPIFKSKTLDDSNRLKRFFFSIDINDRKRIVSGVFWYRPTSILVYKNIFDKLKIFTLINLLERIIWILGNLVILTILKFFVLGTT